MAFKKYNSANNAICTLSVGITNLSMTMTASGNFKRFPTSNFIVKVTQYTDGVVTGRENMLITTRSGSTFSIQTRAYEPVPISDSASSNIQQALNFASGSIIECVASSEFSTDIQNEISRLETDKLNKSGGTMTGVLIEAKGANIASASTVNLASATGNYINITGTTTITSFGTVTAGAVFKITFAGALILAYNATSLILPTSGNITTQAGDTMIIVSEGSGNWRVLNYQRRNGQALDNTTNIGGLTENASPTTSWFGVFFNGTSNFKISLANLVKGLGYATKTAQGVLRFSTDAEATAGTIDTVAITPKQVKNNYGSSFIENYNFTLAATTGNLTINHNLGRVPREIYLELTLAGTLNTNTALLISKGHFLNGTTKTTGISFNYAGSDEYISIQNSSNIIYMNTANGGTFELFGTISSNTANQLQISLAATTPTSRSFNYKIMVR